MGMIRDFFVGRRLPSAMVADALARALSVDPSVVGVCEKAGETMPETEVVLMVIEDDEAGDYPGQYLAFVCDDAPGAPDILRAMAVALQAPIMQDDGRQESDTMILFLPDGSMHPFELEREEDYSFHNTPEMQGLIDRSNGSARDRLTGGWGEEPPIIATPVFDLARIDPREAPPIYRDLWIRKRREAGLPDVPPPE